VVYECLKKPRYVQIWSAKVENKDIFCIWYKFMRNIRCPFTDNDQEMTDCTLNALAFLFFFFSQPGVGMFIWNRAPERYFGCQNTHYRNRKFRRTVSLTNQQLPALFNLNNGDAHWFYLISSLWQERHCTVGCDSTISCVRKTKQKNISN